MKDITVDVVDGVEGVHGGAGEIVVPLNLEDGLFALQQADRLLLGTVESLLPR